MISGGVNRDGKVIQYSLAAWQGQNIKTGCFEPGIYIYGSNHTGAPSAWPGFVISMPVMYGSEGFVRCLKYAFALNGDVYFMELRDNGATIGKDWTKIAGAS